MTRLQNRLSAAKRLSETGANRREAGDSFTKMLTGIALFSIAATGLYGALSPAYHAIQSARQNLRASQIVMQRAESLQLLNGSQVCDTNNQPKPLFVEPRNPRGIARAADGSQYAAYLSTPAPAAGDQASASRKHLRPVTVTLCWTNSDGAKPEVHQRVVQAQLAPNGTPKYLWEPL